MDGEHAFSAAIILVMINIAFPYNLRDRAAMVLALDVLNGMAEKGNLHIRSLHRLLLSLYHTVIPSPTESGDKPASAAPEHEHMSPQPAELAPPETPPTEHRPESQPIQLPHISIDDPLAAFLAAQQSASPIPMSGDSGFIVPEELLSFENPMGDAILWEEGYGTFDVGMDFDWAQWNSWPDWDDIWFFVSISLGYIHTYCLHTVRSLVSYNWFHDHVLYIFIYIPQPPPTSLLPLESGVFGCFSNLSNTSTLPVNNKHPLLSKGNETFKSPTPHRFDECFSAMSAHPNGPLNKQSFKIIDLDSMAL